MNEEHLALCASDEWRDALKQWIMPWALTGVELGNDVIEIGPGPGLTTDELRQQVAGSNVDVVNADATAMPLEADRFTGAVSFTMLHHVPTTDLQNRIFAELARVLAPTGVLVLSDSIASDELRAFHDGDTYNPIDPTTIDARLATAGFDAIDVRVNEYGWSAHARKP
jgi:SAM-dependent methyltransferase